MSKTQRQSLIVRTDKDAIPLAAAALTPCFDDDPVMRYIFRRHNGTTINLIDDPVFRRRIFNILMSLSYGGHAEFVTVDGGWKCTGIMLPPAKHLGGLRGYLACWKDVLLSVWTMGWATSKYVIFEHDKKWVEPFHAAAFPGQPEIMNKGDYYYIYFLGTQVEARGNGWASEYLRYVQEIATKAGKPIYLESSTENNRRLYERNGFKVVKEQTMGKGEVGRDGRVVFGTGSEQSADGVTWWAMTWWPEDLRGVVS